MSRSDLEDQQHRARGGRRVGKPAFSQSAGFRTGPRPDEGAAVRAASRKTREIRGKFGGNSCLDHPSEECPGGGNILQVHYFTMTSLKYAPDGARTTLTNYQKAPGQRGKNHSEKIETTRFSSLAFSTRRGGGVWRKKQLWSNTM